METNWVKESWEFIKEKTEINNERIGAEFPHVSRNKHYDKENPRWWTAGFWPGILWHVYYLSKNEKLKDTAEICEKKMDYLLTDSELVDHDMGFMWTLTSLADYKITGNRVSRKRALLAANLLAGRFNSKGNFIRAWNTWSETHDNSGVAIIDCMMNLGLLYWASEEMKDSRFKHIAESYGQTVLKNFIRDDGSVQHMIKFDSETGEVIERLGGQGFSSESSWARGCAWAIYGLAISYKHTKNIEFLNGAKKTAHYFIANTNGCKCPVWDFRIPENDTRKYNVLDSSAGAIAACGLLLISELVPPFERSFYRESGALMLKNLYFDCSSKNDKEEEGLLYHATGHFPERQNIDVPIIYGDYFFTEGIAMLNGEDISLW